MPGGFTSGSGREGYQTVNDEPRLQTPRVPTSQSHPHQGPPSAPGAQPPAAGAYQSV